jgi:hypothetical protein
MKNLICCLFVFTFTLSYSLATPFPPDEGMWLLHLLGNLNYPDMKAKGLKLKPEQIYSINQASLKDAVVSFGGFCTGEIISKDGLLLTNHHCGYGQIQTHSSVEKDYLKNGFWAMQKSEELPNSGLTATFIVRIEDVSKQVLAGVTPEMNEKDRQNTISEKIKEINKKATEGTHFGSFVRAFYYGNEYYLFVTETFKDVRLVGAPPSAIGKFGGDTDNWMWPRHTGDFSLFRIYANKDNKPADYSPDNVPYKPKHHLPISLKGFKKDDFTMVMGFPGRTQEYLTSYGVKLVMEFSDPYKIKIRDGILKIYDQYMKSADKIRIQYAAKQASKANAWKKWIGEVRGLKKLNTLEKKKQLEAEFEKWAKAQPDRVKKYGEILPKMAQNYQNLEKVSIANDYLNEAVFGIELLDLVWSYSELFNKGVSDVLLEKLKKEAQEHFKDYHLPLDKEVMAFCLEAYNQDVSTDLKPEVFGVIERDFQGNIKKFTESIFEKSNFTSEAKVLKLLEEVKKNGTQIVEQDPAFQLVNEFVEIYSEKVRNTVVEANQVIDIQQRNYMQGLREMLSTKKFYPDANSTLRLTYGKIADYFPYDGAYYYYQTYLEGIIEKGNMEGIEDYQVPIKLLELYNKKEYGQYAENGKLPVCFTASNHTTGGNSGSPVMNAEGQLIGLNFDRNWEGTMSDIMYDPARVRNISVDIRYVLFVIDKFAGAGHLVNEMTIIK